MEEVVNSNHDNFDGMAPLAIRNLGNTDLFSDVTLVSNDNQIVKAHKVILASFSQKLEKILASNPHTNPMIYFNHIDSDTLHRLKTFIYLGHAKVPSDQVYDFIKIGGELGIVGLVEQNGEQGELEKHLGEQVTNNTGFTSEASIEQNYEAEQMVERNTYFSQLKYLLIQNEFGSKNVLDQEYCRVYQKCFSQNTIQLRDPERCYT